jgi:hypothetical protein
MIQNQNNTKGLTLEEQKQLIDYAYEKSRKVFVKYFFVTLFGVAIFVFVLLAMVRYFVQ